MADGLTIRISTEFFFDRKKVIDAVDRGTRKAMSKGLVFIRKRARSSIRKDKVSSRAGKPPRSQSSNPTVSIRNILFAYDPASKSGVCGPIKLNRRATDVRTVKTLPATMEFGGSVAFKKGALIPRTGKNKAGRDSRGKFTKSTNGKYYVVTRPFIKNYRARPFMVPALEKEVALGNVLDAWKGQVSE